MDPFKVEGRARVLLALVEAEVGQGVGSSDWVEQGIAIQELQYVSLSTRNRLVLTISVSQAGNC